MIQGLSRKLKQLQADPVLRAWLIGRAFGKWPSAPDFTPHQPPYLIDQLPLSFETPSSQSEVKTCMAKPPGQQINIDLPGETITLSPDNPAALFDRAFNDIETELGAHRFAWLDAPISQIDTDWTSALWTAWVSKFGDNQTGWAWHPYTATERAINIIKFATRHGWPGDAVKTCTLIAAHAPIIADQLEYFGEHDTSNHLTNNGRGLFIIGATLGLPRAIQTGMDILIHEAARIFTSSGILREGSSHYHALYARRYAECATLAREHNIDGADTLSEIASRAMKALSQLYLPGGLPLIGDISPDIAPNDLQAMMKIAPASDALNADGWLRMDRHDWHGLWHCAPDGWSQMPGHGHQDVGGFELHWENERVIVDPGRGSYGEDGDSALYRSGDVHNGLTVNGQDPYPPNKPYYTPAFRQSVCGPPPSLIPTDTGARLQFDGFQRLGEVSTVSRQWSFDEHKATLHDAVDGKGDVHIRRQLVTPLPATVTDNGVVIAGSNKSFHIHGATHPKLKPITIWHAYGQGRPGTAIVFNDDTVLPWQDNLMIEVV